MNGSISKTWLDQTIWTSIYSFIKWVISGHMGHRAKSTNNKVVMALPLVHNWVRSSAQSQYPGQNSQMAALNLINSISSEHGGNRTRARVCRRRIVWWRKRNIRPVIDVLWALVLAYLHPEATIMAAKKSVRSPKPKHTFVLVTDLKSLHCKESRSCQTPLTSLEERARMEEDKIQEARRLCSLVR